MHDFPMWIGGQPATTEAAYTLHLPYDGSATARVAEGDLKSFEQACVAAGSGAAAMAALTNLERSDLLLRAAALLKSELSELAELLALETGKPIKEARVEAERGQQTLIGSAIAARELAGEAIPIDGAPAG